MNIFDLLKQGIELGGSDIHITVQKAPIVRIKGKFENLSDKVLTSSDTKQMTIDIAGEKNFKRMYNMCCWLYE